MKKSITIVVIIFIFFSSCSTRQIISGNYSYETSCLGSDFDGSQIVRAFGTGKYKNDAIENGKIRALRDVIFNGIREGKGDCKVSPLIVGVNVEEKYEDYFNHFFSKDGGYSNFVKNNKRPVLMKLFRGKRTRELDVAYEVIVKIYMSDLKQHLKGIN